MEMIFSLLLTKEREKQGISQERLCRGLCAVSNLDLKSWEGCQHIALAEKIQGEKEKAVEMWKLLLQDYGNSKVRMEYHFQEVMLANRIYAMKEFHDEIGKDVFRLRHGIFLRFL